MNNFHRFIGGSYGKEFWIWLRFEGFKLCKLSCAKIEGKTKNIVGVEEADFNLSNEIFTLKIKMWTELNLQKKSQTNSRWNRTGCWNFVSIDEDVKDEKSYVELLKTCFPILSGLILNINIEHKYKLIVFLFYHISRIWSNLFSNKENKKWRFFR